MKSTRKNSNLFACKICVTFYDEKEIIPKVISCGHTLCSVCFENLKKNRTYSFREIKCPFCNKSIPSGFEPIINYEIISNLKFNKSEKEKVCQVHNEYLLFFCHECDENICHLCHFEVHIGHKVGKIDFKKSAIKTLIKTIDKKIPEFDKEIENNMEFIMEKNELQFSDSMIEKIKIAIKAQILEFKLIKEEFQILKSKFVMCYENNLNVTDDESENLEQSFTSINNKLDDFSNKSKTNGLSNFCTIIKKIFIETIDKVNSFYEKTDNKILKYHDIEIKSIDNFLESGQILDILYKPCSSQKNIDLINSIAKEYGIKNNRILSILKSIDRADFYDKFDENKEILNLYEDTTISSGETLLMAPHMYMVTLNYISKYFTNFGKKHKVLDIGSGTGFFSLCLAKYFGPDCKVLGLDTNLNTLEQSKSNINKNHKLYFQEKVIKLAAWDGLEGSSDLGPYDIIHFGAACHEIPTVLINQLSPGGIIWIPLGRRNKKQKITILKKNLDEKLVTYELFDTYCESLNKPLVNISYLMGESVEDLFETYDKNQKKWNNWKISENIKLATVNFKDYSFGRFIIWFMFLYNLAMAIEYDNNNRNNGNFILKYLFITNLSLIIVNFIRNSL